MKKSSQVPAKLVVALAGGFSLAGCGSDPITYECHDATGRLLPDYNCRSGKSPGAHWVQTGGFGGSGGYYGGGGGGG